MDALPNYALVTRDPKIASDPVIIAALAKAKDSDAKFYAAAGQRGSQAIFSGGGALSALPPNRHGRRQTSRRYQGSLN
jgi:hypothetical protein